MTNETMNDIASKSLGSSASYAVYTDKFDSSLLNPMPRELARKSWGIRGDEFSGADVWHCREATFLLDSGKPVSGTLKFVYSSDSDFMVESKSMKLYLNTFDMCKMGKTASAYGDASKNYCNQIVDDLTTVLRTPVSVSFHTADSEKAVPLESLFKNLDEVVSDSVTFDDYSSTNSYIKTTGLVSEERTQRWYTPSLRSRCRHTKQKDTGTAFFDISHDLPIDPVSILRQVIALREVNEFHEFCAEKLFVEFKNSVDPRWLTVALLYARRGSLDINPVRWNRDGAQSRFMFSSLISNTILTPKVFGQ